MLSSIMCNTYTTIKCREACYRRRHVNFSNGEIYEERLTGNVVYSNGQDQQNDSPPAASCLTAHFLCFRTHVLLLRVVRVGTPASLVHLSILNFI